MSNTTFPKWGTGTAYPSGHLSLFRFFITSVLLIFSFLWLIMLSIFWHGLYFLLCLVIFFYVSEVSCEITTVQADSELSVTHKLTSDHVSQAHFGIICN
jgi:hypothetical protein